jgi:hypothetical protein
MHEDKSVTGDHTSHITVTHSDGGIETTSVYAVSQDIARELDRKRDWLGSKPVGQDLRVWLGKKGCRLDSSVGPAIIRRFADGSTWEGHYRDGEAHREDGPAIVRRFADGSTEEYFYRDGRLEREGGPAIVWRWPDGSTEKEMLSR